MEDLVTWCFILLQVFVLTSCQRIAPGVPPQQYQPQQPPPPPQYQQVPQQHYQQPQVQQPQPQMQGQQPPYQQIPVQQQQQQVHMGQPSHAHGHHAQPQQLLNTANIALEKEHIQEHLDVPIDTSKMTEQELQFHYFKMHDADNNNKLDGCELIKSLIHWHENEENDKETKIQKDHELEKMIDPIFTEMDANNDGRGEMMDQKLMYAFRGWIGFVAFMDLGAAGRCFMEGKSFFGTHSNLNAITFQDTDLDEPTLPRILGYLSILKAIALTHCTLFIHYKPLISLGICSLALAIYMNLTEALYYHSTTLNFYIVFPSVLNALTLIGLLIIPKHLLEPQVVNEDENVELLRQAAALRRKRHNKKET